MDPTLSIIKRALQVIKPLKLQTSDIELPSPKLKLNIHLTKSFLNCVYTRWKNINA